MADKSFQNELQGAQERFDRAEFIFDLRDYYRFDRHNRGQEPYERTKGGNFSAVMDAPLEDPDRGLAYVALAMAEYEDSTFLGLLSAGLLVDLLRDPTPEMLDRIVAEGRKTPRFRWMLSGVWLHAIAERARAPVQAIVGDYSIEQPLPPAPFRSPPSTQFVTPQPSATDSRSGPAANDPIAEIRLSRVHLEGLVSRSIATLSFAKVRDSRGSFFKIR